MDEGIDPIKEVEHQEIVNEKEGDDVDSFVREAIEEAKEEGIKEAIEEVLIEEGVKPTPELVEKGYEMLTKEPDKKEVPKNDQAPEMKKTVGPMPAPSTVHPKDDVPKDKEFRQWVAPAKNDLTSRERLEASAEGLKIFVEKEHEKLVDLKKRKEQEMPGTSERDIFSLERSIWQAEEKIKQLEGEIAKLPTRKEPDTKNASEFTKEVLQQEQSAREAKKDFIRDMHSTGINMNDKWGTEVPGETFDEYGRLIEDARKKSEEAFGK